MCVLLSKYICCVLCKITVGLKICEFSLVFEYADLGSYQVPK